MKGRHWLIAVLSIVSMNIYSATGYTEPDSTICLEVEGKVLNAGENKSPTIVRLYEDKQVVDSVILKGNKKKFRFLLSRNKHYSIVASKEGFQSKNVCVHTHITDPEMNIYQFYFEMNLLSIDSPPAAAAMPEKLPVAVIYFEPRKHCFYYNRTTTSNINRDTCMLML